MLSGLQGLKPSLGNPNNAEQLEKLVAAEVHGMLQAVQLVQHNTTSCTMWAAADVARHVAKQSAASGPAPSALHCTVPPLPLGWRCVAWVVERGAAAVGVLY
jgi:hypothetical protein